ncbi:MAG TPA: DUF4870 domain-containing protein [Bryobacteraceae bacterium]|nr:DUF4870 domain-containing protein [Bryobacteraceae bacterium]HOL70646.1 DUF4870 domain-containing protein [Bryobacteraceae bacterium]HOQ45962.1 DUF4870 domain-containing protein [Bryobacteraceae bacterium]HPQ15635.1 DUF4870 domain-containing protein [Bryobacteraceae bacterium]HPU73219.1 DUF4870 domain-containing protein [Bryobacteraceae bacterium]
MPFCRNCGTPGDGQFCAKCGTPLAAPGADASAAPPPAQPQPQAYSQPAQTAAGGMADNVAGLLCYILGLITGILFLVLAPYNQNKTVRFHAFQSIFFNIAWIALFIVGGIVGGILTAALPLIGSMLWGLISFVLWIAGLVIWIILMVKAYSGQKWVLPIVGPLAEKQA